MGSLITLSYWNWNGPEGEVTPRDRDLVNRFHKLHPDIRVERHGAPWNGYYAAFQEALASQEPPDVMLMSCIWLPPLVKDRLLLNLEPLIARDRQTGDWDPHERVDPRQLLFTRWHCGDVQGDLYALPFGTAPGFILWNKTLFEQTGVKTPLEHYREGTWTVEVFESLTRRISAPPDRWGYLNPVGLWPQKVHLMVQGGATWWDWNRERFAFASTGGARALKWELELSTKHGVAPPIGSKTPDFRSGRVATTYGIGFRLGLPGALPFEWDAVPCPRWPRTRYTLLWDFNFVAIPKTCRNPEAAWEWVKFLVDPPLDIIEKWGWTNLPVTQTPTSLKSFLNTTAVGSQTILDALPDSWNLGGGFTRHWQSLHEEVFGPTLRDIYSGSQPVDRALQAAEDAMNACLEEG